MSLTDRDEVSRLGACLVDHCELTVLSLDLTGDSRRRGALPAAILKLPELPEACVDFADGEADGPEGRISRSGGKREEQSGAAYGPGAQPTECRAI